MVPGGFCLRMLYAVVSVWDFRSLFFPDMLDHHACMFFSIMSTEETGVAVFRPTARLGTFSHRGTFAR
jgi:hypothetical protein